jgi:hypothetical protein
MTQTLEQSGNTIRISLSLDDSLRITKSLLTKEGWSMTQFGPSRLVCIANSTATKAPLTIDFRAHSLYETEIQIALVQSGSQIGQLECKQALSELHEKLIQGNIIALSEGFYKRKAS